MELKRAIKKIKETFIMSDRDTIGHMIVNDILIPGIKDGIYKRISGTVALFLYGSTSKRPQAAAKSSTTTYSYSSQRPGAAETRIRRLSDISVPNEGRAMSVLEELNSYIYDFGKVTIEEYYHILGADRDADDAKYGWTTLEAAKIYPFEDEWKIHLPIAKKLG